MSELRQPYELIAGHIPVIQQGYIDLFDRHPGAMIGVFDNDILDRYGYLKKDIRALRPEAAVRAIEGLGREVRFLGQKALTNIALTTSIPLFMPDDDISNGVIQSIGLEADRVTLEPVFLRWDRRNTNANLEIEPDARIKASDLNPEILRLLSIQQEKSANMWRHVGAVVAQGDTILASSHNHSLPTEYSSVIDGEPRNTARRGEAIDLSLDIHAESELIAQAAKNGTSLDHADLYVTTFPCPNCAKQMAVAGIGRCFYGEGYAMLDGQSVLQSFGVEVIKIDGLEGTPNPDSLRSYPPTN